MGFEKPVRRENWRWYSWVWDGPAPWWDGPGCGAGREEGRDPGRRRRARPGEGSKEGGSPRPAAAPHGDGQAWAPLCTWPWSSSHRGTRLGPWDYRRRAEEQGTRKPARPRGLLAAKGGGRRGGVTAREEGSEREGLQRPRAAGGAASVGRSRGLLARLVPPAPACRPLQPIVPLGGLFWALARLQSWHRVGRTGADDRRVPQGRVGQTEGAPPAACRAPPSTPSGAAGSGPRPHPRVPPHRPPPHPPPWEAPGSPTENPRGGEGEVGRPLLPPGPAPQRAPGPRASFCRVPTPSSQDARVPGCRNPQVLSDLDLCPRWSPRQEGGCGHQRANY